MKRKFILFGLMLMGMAAMFTTSCVQGDLYDEFYDEDGVFFARKKKNKGDINPQTIERIKNEIDYEVLITRNYVLPNENECVAYAIYNYSGLSLSKSREKVGLAAFVCAGCPTSETWQSIYVKQAIKGAGVSISDSGMDNLMSTAVGASNHSDQIERLKPQAFVSYKKYNGDKIVGLALGKNEWHYGVLKGVKYFDNSHEWIVIIKDQKGEQEYYQFSLVKALYY